jgi:nucleotide-binding universal stress UspA family protein
MKEFSRIIAPVDESKDAKWAAQKALYLAKKTGKEFVALYVIDTPRLTQTVPPDETSVAWEAILKKQGNFVLDEIERKGKKIGVRVVKKLVEGIPDQEIIKEAKKNDIIVMGCKKKNTIDKLLIGSVCDGVKQHSSSPVMIYQMKK